MPDNRNDENEQSKSFIWLFTAPFLYFLSPFILIPILAFMQHFVSEHSLDLMEPAFKAFFAPIAFMVNKGLLPHYDKAIGWWLGVFGLK